MVIALCGKSGSGKSVISNALKKRGAYVIDADKIGKNIMCGSVLAAVETEFPDCVNEGVLDRRALSKRVFQNDDELKKLNSITHPAIREKILSEIRENSGKYRVIVVDAAVLIEANMADIADFTVAVLASDSVRLSRIMARDGIDEDLARARISAQMPDEFYIENTDFSVVNDGTVEHDLLALKILERSGVLAENRCVH